MKLPSARVRAFGLAMALGMAGPVAACSSTEEPAVTPTPTPVPSASVPTETICKDGRATPDYPEGPYAVAVGRTLPDLALEGIRPTGETDTVRLREHYVPCAQEARVLVLRVHGGTWCGSCVWHAEHGLELLDGPDGKRLSAMDLVVGGPDADRVRLEDLSGFRAKMDSASRVSLVADPDFSLRGIAPAEGAPLPLYVFVDARTMKVTSYASNPDPDDLAYRVHSTLAKLDGAPIPKEAPASLVDGLFTRNEWDMIRAIGTPEALPRDPTNAVADDPKAAALGEALFSDVGLSPSGEVACVTCHDPKKALADGRPTPGGRTRGTRRTPRIGLSAYSRWQFWDGRADTLWAQALGPFENPDEIASSRLRVARRVIANYETSYAMAFPGHALPAPSMLAGLPDDGKPGDASYDALPAATKEAITRVFVDVGKAIAAFERTFRPAEMRLDAYARGDFSALTTLEKTGLSVFAHVGCMQCHWGPRLTDDAFHVTRMGTGRPDGIADRGRAEALRLLASNEFGKASAWSDARTPLAISLEPSPATVGAFKTPSLRGVADLGPYGHGGTLGTLVEVTELYGKGGLPAGDSRTVGVLEPWLPTFDETTQWSLAPFVEGLKSR